VVSALGIEILHALEEQVVEGRVHQAGVVQLTKAEMNVEPTGMVRPVWIAHTNPVFDCGKLGEWPRLHFTGDEPRGEAADTTIVFNAD
jgi:hypothetical protein